MDEHDNNNIKINSMRLLLIIISYSLLINIHGQKDIVLNWGASPKEVLKTDYYNFEVKNTGESKHLAIYESNNIIRLNEYIDYRLIYTFYENKLVSSEYNYIVNNDNFINAKHQYNTVEKNISNEHGPPDVVEGILKINKASKLPFEYFNDLDFLDSEKFKYRFIFATNRNASDTVINHELLRNPDYLLSHELKFTELKYFLSNIF